MIPLIFNENHYHSSVNSAFLSLTVLSKKPFLDF